MKYVSEECLLEAGEYIVSIRSLNCMEFSNREYNDDTMELVGADGKLTKHFKMTLMNMFDMFDFDESGKLSREEFEIYNVLASGEHVLDQEWEILCKCFELKNEELTMNAFISLHQIEADGNPDLTDIWMSLISVGYDKRLDLVENCPCSFTIFSESQIHMREVKLREPTKIEEEALGEYFWRNGKEVDNDIDIRIWKCDYFAIGVAGPMKLPYAVNLHYERSANVLVKEHISLQRIPLKFIKPKILLQAVAKESEWSLNLTVETTT
ncbi:unnamed protein product [Thelazia callipaeda]|uniref:EF-hand domain-containing protein n=1 Tax=Thelazia callipaeda TaxID=103827 RepID=A0A0N5CJC2_THECL|nr:unnamed protein product [Thelazia callipaeda]